MKVRGRIMVSKKNQKTTESAETTVKPMGERVEVVFVLDKSGSMCGLEKDTIGGFNSTINNERSKGGEVTVSTVLFSEQFDVIHDRIPIADVPELTSKDYVANGGTALLDAVGDSIQHIRKVHAGLKPEDVPGKVVFFITTDGQENSSREYTYASVKKLIEIQKKCGWEFVFFGANIDAAKEAGRFGIDRDHSVDYLCDEGGLNAVYDAASNAIDVMRSDMKLHESSWRDKVDKDYDSRN